MDARFQPLTEKPCFFGGFGRRSSGYGYGYGGGGGGGGYGGYGRRNPFTVLIINSSGSSQLIFLG